MRLTLAALIWVALMGGLTLYMQTRESLKPPENLDIQSAAGIFSLEITTTAPLEPDPFALTAGQDKPGSLRVMLNGKEILRKSEIAPAGSTTRVQPVPELLRGHNEFYVEANPTMDAGSRPVALRVRLLKDDEVLFDRSLWSEPGGITGGVVGWDETGAKEGSGSDHDH